MLAVLRPLRCFICVQIRYTPNLRQYDAGVLTLGQQAIAIPPGEPTFALQPNVSVLGGLVQAFTARGI